MKRTANSFFWRADQWTKRAQEKELQTRASPRRPTAGREIGFGRLIPPCGYVVHTTTRWKRLDGWVQAPLANRLSADIIGFAVLQVPTRPSPVGTSFFAVPKSCLICFGTPTASAYCSLGSYETTLAVGSGGMVTGAGSSPAFSRTG